MHAFSLYHSGIPTQLGDIQHSIGSGLLGQEKVTKSVQRCVVLLAPVNISFEKSSKLYTCSNLVDGIPCAFVQLKPSVALRHQQASIQSLQKLLQITNMHQVLHRSNPLEQYSRGIGPGETYIGRGCVSGCPAARRVQLCQKHRSLERLRGLS